MKADYHHPTHSEHTSDIESDPENDGKSKPIPGKLKKSRKPPPVAQSMNEETKLTYLPPLPDKGKVKEDLAPIQETSKPTEVFKDKPIQLVRINHDIGKFQVCEAGVKALQGIEGNIGVVAFSGLYRTGKSFTLNLLLDKLGKGVGLFSLLKTATTPHSLKLIQP